MSESHDLLRFDGIEPELEVRSEPAREIAIAFMKYGEIGRTQDGLEMFEAGAFNGADANSVILRSEHEGPPAGRGISLEERGDRAILVAKAANTPRGDELLTLAKEGYFRGASPSFISREGGSTTKYVGRDRVTVRRSVDLREVSLTWRPTYAGTEVLYARTQVLEDRPVTEENGIQASNVVDVEQRLSAVEQRSMNAKESEELQRRLLERVEALEERGETSTGAEVPAPSEVPMPYRGDWFQAAATLLDGGSLTSLQERALSDILTTANAGFVPPAYSSELVGVIDPRRQFLASTRRIDMPSNGMQIIFPRIGTRPVVAEQVTQKTEVASGPVTTDTVTANVRTFAGAGDISLQLLRRSDPSFLNFYIELLAERYAKTTEAAALTALTGAGISQGGAWTVGTGTFPLGTALTNAVNALGEPPDTIWLSTAAMAAMINAKGADNRPLYSAGTLPTLGNANTAEGASSLSGLRVVWTPALDASTFDADPLAGVQPARAIVGPSRGFVWAEEGTFTLQADVPGRLGRDVALAGFIAFLPVYPAAFTAYALA